MRAQKYEGKVQNIIIEQKVARSRFELLSPGFFSHHRDPEPEIPSPTYHGDWPLDSAPDSLV
jgi:hypothetical protein